MLNIQMTVGRLIEIRGRDEVTLPEFGTFRTQFTDLVVQAGRRVVFIADLRGLQVNDKQVFEAVLRLMRTDNAIIERNAYLVDRGSRLALEIDHAIISAGNAARRICFTVAEATAWLTPALEPAEVAELQKFLA